jgi:hypothetical protein
MREQSSKSFTSKRTPANGPSSFPRPAAKAASMVLAAAKSPFDIDMHERVQVGIGIATASR